MTGGIVLVLVAALAIAQLTRGEALQRLKIVGS